MTTKKPATGITHQGCFFDQDKLLQLHDMMLMIRRFEEKAGQLYGLRKIGGFCHLCNGQEAVCVGTDEASEAEDYFMTGYRDHGHVLARGADPTAVMAELLGRSGGIVKGKGGSMHMFSKAHNFVGGNGIVGEQVPIGLGFGFASNYRNDGRVTFCFMGDGAINQGAVYESFNMASLWKLPIVFVVENNQYAMGTALNRASAETHLYKRGISFKVPGMQVDGMDVLEVATKTAEARAHAASGEGPMILEMITYRYRGHSMSDPATYRSREEVDEWRSGRDPIARLQKQIIKLGVTDVLGFKEKDKVIKKAVAEIAKAAEAQPEPDSAEMWQHAYAQPIDGAYPYPGKVG